MTVVVEGEGETPPSDTPDIASILAAIEAARVAGEERGAQMQLLSDRLALAEAAVIEARQIADSATADNTYLREEIGRAHERITNVETTLAETIAMLEEDEGEGEGEGEGQGGEGEQEPPPAPAPPKRKRHY